MQSSSRILFVGRFKKIRWHRKVSVVASLRKEEFIVKSSLEDIVLPRTTLIERLWRDAAGFQDQVALESAETGKKYTYKQLQSNISSFATSIHKKLGLKSGDVIAAIIPNQPEFPVVSFGALQAGCILTTINPIYREYEISHQVSTTLPKVIVTVPECYNDVLKGLKRSNVNAKIVVIDKIDQPVPDGTIRFSELAEKGGADLHFLDKIEKQLDDVAFIPFSSGTTGLPKGVEITYKNIIAGLETMHHERVCFPNLTTDRHQDVVPCVLPFFHIYGLVVVLTGHLAKGCKLITMSKFSASSYFDILKNKKASILYVVPPLAMLLSKHPDVGWEHLQYARHLISGAAPMSESDILPLLEKTKGKMEIGQGFGATETTSLTTTTLKGSKGDYSAAGVPMSSIELMFLDPATGQPVPVGEQGELAVRGPVVMKGYHKNPKATEECFTEDGFFKTGDLGSFKQGVGLYINDRLKELIKVKGMQVAPAELESLLRTHPGVSEAAVIGVPHELHGETPKAFIVTKPKSQVTAEEIQEFVAAKVAKFKHIEYVQFVSDIPKTASGKILRKELKSMST